MNSIGRRTLILHGDHRRRSRSGTRCRALNMARPPAKIFGGGAA
jgi:hypothetical protein